MEANINNFLFKFGSEAERAHGFIRVNPDITEKEFHFEISDWFISSANN